MVLQAFSEALLEILTEKYEILGKSIVFRKPEKREGQRDALAYVIERPKKGGFLNRSDP